MYNGNPGLTNLRVEVNGTVLQVAGLKTGEHRALDVSTAMSNVTNNTVVVTPTGKPGSSAWVMVHD